MVSELAAAKVQQKPTRNQEGVLFVKMVKATTVATKSPHSHRVQMANQIRMTKSINRMESHIQPPFLEARNPEIC